MFQSSVFLQFISMQRRRQTEIQRRDLNPGFVCLLKNIGVKRGLMQRRSPQDAAVEQDRWPGLAFYPWISLLAPADPKQSHHKKHREGLPFLLFGFSFFSLFHCPPCCLCLYFKILLKVYRKIEELKGVILLIVTEILGLCSDRCARSW